MACITTNPRNPSVNNTNVILTMAKPCSTSDLGSLDNPSKNLTEINENNQRDATPPPTPPKNFKPPTPPPPPYPNPYKLPIKKSMSTNNLNPDFLSELLQKSKKQFIKSSYDIDLEIKKKTKKKIVLLFNLKNLMLHYNQRLTN